MNKSEFKSAKEIKYSLGDGKKFCILACGA